MVVTIDSKFYSKLQLGISKYQEKTPADPLNCVMSNHEGIRTKLGYLYECILTSCDPCHTTLFSFIEKNNKNITILHVDF